MIPLELVTPYRVTTTLVRDDDTTDEEDVETLMLDTEEHAVDDGDAALFTLVRAETRLELEALESEAKIELICVEVRVDVCPEIVTLTVTTEVLLYVGDIEGLTEGARVGLKVGNGVGTPNTRVLVAVIARDPTEIELLVANSVAIASLAMYAMAAA